MSGSERGHFTRAYARVRGGVLVACLLASALVAPLVLATDAGAAVSESSHVEPWTGVAGVSLSPVCDGESPGYSCTLAGYSAWLKNPSGWAWNFYGGSYPSVNSYGPHNCTLYVAFRLQGEGVELTWSANAATWAQEAAANGEVVNQTPAPGSVAQWNDGHVAWVDAVTAHYIVITSDNYQPYGTSTFPGGFTDSFEIARTSPAMPDNFIHFVAPVVSLSRLIALRQLQHAAN